MRKILVFLIASLAIIGCSKSEDDYSLADNYKDRYYVRYKYSLIHRDPHIGYDVVVKYISNHNDTITKHYSGKTIGLSDEHTCGPFKVNDVVHLELRNNDKSPYSHYTTNMSIEVSKNNEPFTEKCVSNGKSLTYQIQQNQ